MIRTIFGSLRGLWAPIVIMTVVAIFLVLTYQLPHEARTMPVRVAWVTLALAFLDLLTRTHTALGTALMRMLNPANEKGKEEAGPEASWSRQMIGVSLPILLAASLMLFGVMIGGPLFIFATIWLADRSRLVMALLITLCMGTFLWLIFGFVLKLTLFPGLLFGGSL